MKCIRVLAAVILLGVVLLGIKETVLATGSAGISGYADTSTVIPYNNPRRVTNPALPGPEVVFAQNYGYSGLWLGSWDCSSYPGPLYPQSYGVYSPVGYYSVPTTFCIATWADTTSGNFGGTLAWD